MEVDGRFKKGLQLFNEKKFFECHDVIEELWLETSAKDPHRDLYKGVIQAAAAIYQYERGIISGAIGLYETSVSNLEKYSPSRFGLNIKKLMDDMSILFRPLKGWKGEGKPPLPEELVPKLDYAVD